MFYVFRQRSRKLTALILVGILLILSLAGCKKDEPTAESTAEPTLPTEAVDVTSPIVTTEPPTEPEEPILTGTVTAEELNVREGVGVKFEVVDTLVKNDAVEIFEKQDLNGVMWGRIRTGWICLAYVQLDGEPGSIPQPPEYTMTGPVTGTIIATELNVRGGPGTNYHVTGTLKRGQEITVTELSGNWGKTENGWVNTFFVYFKDSIDSTAIDVEITGEDLNLRSGPGTGYESLDKLSSGTIVTILKQVVVRDVRWGYTGDGWICLDYAKAAEAE